VTAEEMMKAIEHLKAMGAKRAKVGDIDVEFSEAAESPGEDMMQVLEKGIDQGRAEVLQHLTDDQRAAIEQKMDDAVNYGSS